MKKKVIACIILAVLIFVSAAFEGVGTYTRADTELSDEQRNAIAISNGDEFK